jgi:ubiquitin carboxyl-terminal hydrolase 25/28
MLSDKALMEMGFSEPLIENAKIVAREEKKNLLEVILALDKKTKEIRHQQPKTELEVLYSEAIGELGSVEDETREEGLPVGLKNVSNCCYLNSLLQSYFYCGPLYKAVMEFRRPAGSPPQSDLSKQRRVQAAYELVGELRRLFTAMAYSNKRSIDPTPLLRHLVNDEGHRVNMGEERDLCEFNMLLLGRLEDAFTHGQAGPSIIKQLYFMEKVEELNNELQPSSEALGCILSSQGGSLLKALKDELCYSVEIEGR